MLIVYLAPFRIGASAGQGQLDHVLISFRIPNLMARALRLHSRLRTAIA